MTIVLIAAQIAAFLLVFLYLIYKSAQKKNPPLLTLVGILFLVGTTAAGVYFLATVRAEHLGHKEWRLEREYFFGLFTDKLAASGNLKTAAKYMQSQEVKEKTLRQIQQIAEPFQTKGIYYLSAGGLILLLTAISLWIRKISAVKCYPYIFIIFVFAGGVLFDIGFYHWQYASETEDTLESFLHFQQAFLMRDLAGVETDLSIPDIIRITKEEAGKSGRRRGERLLNALEKKNNYSY